MASDKKKRMEKELEQIRRMQSISDVIDRSSSENTLLYTSSRENESMSDDVIDSMLNKMSGKESERNIRIVESLSRDSSGNEIVKRKRISVTVGKPKHVKIHRHVHVVKHKKGKPRQAPKRKPVKGKPARKAKPQRGKGRASKRRR